MLILALTSAEDRMVLLMLLFEEVEPKVDDGDDDDTVEERETECSYIQTIVAFNDMRCAHSPPLAPKMQTYLWNSEEQEGG